MICNLNQLSFQQYGSIDSERVNARNLNLKAGESRVVELSSLHNAVYRCAGQVWVCNDSNMSVLSVSLDGQDYQNFYLDKVVCIKPGVYFTLSAYQDTSTIQIAEESPLETVGTITQEDKYRIKRRIDVSSIYTFFYHEKEKGFIFPGESHKPLELTYVDKGSIHSVADGKDMLLNQGDLVVYGPNQWHMQYADVDVSASYITISFDLEGEYPQNLLNQKFTIPQSAVPSLQQMLKEYDRMDEFSEDLLICSLQTLLLTVLREQSSPAASKLRTTNAVNSENEIIRRAQQYISAHVREKLTVPLVARHVDVSPSYLTALFRKNLQISPGEYVRRVKLQESKQMIREDNMNFTEIAAALQYSTVHHFSRQFKDKFGITPTEYAKSVR